MTAPSLYQQEMAKRNIAIPKATGCPRARVAPRPPVITPEPSPRRGAGRPASAAIAERNARWAVLYTQGEFTMREIALRANVSRQAVEGALKQLGVTMRAGGHGHLVNRLHRRIAELERDTQLLHARLNGLRLRLRKYGEAT